MAPLRLPSWLQIALCSLILLALSSSQGGLHAFEYSAYCAKACMRGRGGNLCKCSAVHFAGKRVATLNRDHPLGRMFAQSKRSELSESGKKMGEAGPSEQQLVAYLNTNQIPDSLLQEVVWIEERLGSRLPVLLKQLAAARLEAENEAPGGTGGME